MCAIFHSHGHIDHFGCIKIRCRLTPGHTAGVLSFFATFDDGTVAAMHGGIGGNIMTIPFLKNTEANFKQYIATYDNP
ncbi:MAG: hypothetical protein E7395_04265 [Ruminococcaceae bacterium]|nr:hypothetical protein [Oscillospiraceae bacterium]